MTRGARKDPNPVLSELATALGQARRLMEQLETRVPAAEQTEVHQMGQAVEALQLRVGRFIANMVTA